MSALHFHSLSLRYSSWSIRPWLALTASGARFETHTVELPQLGRASGPDGPGLVDQAASELSSRRGKGSVTGLFPVLEVDGTPIHESLAICEWVADAYPAAGLWPESAIERARARAICSEMATGFSNLRTHMSCHVFARVPGFVPSEATQVDIKRVMEIWEDGLERSGGPFLFGRFTIADCFYFPVITRFRTYDVSLSGRLEGYARAVESSDAVGAWREVAARAPAIPAYDEMILGLGGELLDRR